MIFKADLCSWSFTGGVRGEAEARVCAYRMFVAERDGADVDAEDEAVAEVQEQSDHGGEGHHVSTAGMESQGRSKISFDQACNVNSNLDWGQKYEL